MPCVLLSQTVEGFLLRKEAEGVSPNTLRNYRTDLARFLSQVDDLPLDAVEPRHIEGYLAWLRQQRVMRFGKPTPDKLSPKSVRNTWGTLSVFFRWAGAEFDLPSPFRVRMPKVPTRPIKPFTADEVRRLLAAADKKGRQTRHRDRALVLALLDTGARVSELCGAVADDYEAATGLLLLRQTKGGSPRYVFLGTSARHALWRYLVGRGPTRKAAPLFASRGGKRPLTRHAVRLLVASLGTAANVKNAHPHRMRHTMAVEFLRASGDLLALQTLLGHKDLESTRGYLRAMGPEDLRRAHERACLSEAWRL